MSDEDKTFSGSFVLDLRIWWRQTHTLYYLLVWELSSGTTDRISSSRQVGAPATLQTISRDLSRLRRSTTSAEESGVLAFSALLVSFLLDFPWILPLCSLLLSGNLRHKRHSGLVFLWSSSSRRDFWSLCLSTQGHCGFQVCLLPRFSVYGCALFGRFPFPWRRSCFAFASSVSCDFVNSRPVMMLTG